MLRGRERLRQDLIDYHKNTMQEGFPQAATEIPAIEKATEEELIKLATKLHFSLAKYFED